MTKPTDSFSETFHAQLSAAARWAWPVLSPLYRLRNILFGLLFSAYVRFLHPWLLGLLANARESGQTYVLLGLVIFTLQAFELMGVWLKLPVVQARAARWPNDSALAKFGVGAAQIAHLFMALMVFNNSLPFFGMDRLCFDYDTHFAPCFLSTLGFLIIVVKELIVQVFFLAPKTPTRPIDPDAPLIKIRETIGEGFLLLFGMVAFTLSWHGIVDVLDPADAADKVVTLIGSLVLFMAIYPPSRLVFVAEAWLVKQPLFSRLVNLAFFLITLLAALASVPGLF